MKIEIIQGQNAVQILEDKLFLSEWNRLCDNCPWATSYQGPEFCRAWFKSYKNNFFPLFIVSFDESRKKICALLPLAYNRKSEKIVVAGDYQTDYQCWISLPEIGNIFPLAAIKALRKKFKKGIIKFEYIPPGTPIEWIPKKRNNNNVKIIEKMRPVLKLKNGKIIENELNKKRYKDRIKRLEKNGSLVLKKIENKKEFDDYFNVIIDCYDFRQKTIYGHAPFLEDEYKKQFHLAMIESSGLLDVRILMFGDVFAAGHIGVCSKKGVHLGIMAHNPLLSKYSPAKLLIFIMAKRLLEEGKEWFDLTPGGDLYKNRYANEEEKVYCLTVYLSLYYKIMETIKDKSKNVAKILLKAGNIEPVYFKRHLKKMMQFNYIRMISNISQYSDKRIRKNREVRIFFHSAEKANAYTDSDEIHRNVQSDLLRLLDQNKKAMTSALLMKWLKRLEAGNRVYTLVEKNRLIKLGWLSERLEKILIEELQQEYTLPAKSAFLYDFYAIHDDYAKKPYELLLQQMLKDAARVAGTERIYIAVSHKDKMLIETVEKMDFIFEKSL